MTDVGAYFPHRVTYHPTCHSLRLLRVGDRPLRLLRAVDGIELAELPDADQCCGFGGTFALKNPAVSSAMLADKIAAIQATAASVVTAGDASCLLHIGGGLSRLNRASASGTLPRSSPRPGAAGDIPRHAGRAAGCRPAPATSAVPGRGRPRRWTTSQLRRNLRHATSAIRVKRTAAVAEVPDWAELRAAGAAIKDDVLAHLDQYLIQLEAAGHHPRRHGPLGWRRTRGDARSSPPWSARPGKPRW